MKLIISGLVFLGCMLLHALAEGVAEVLGDAVGEATASWRRRLWQALVRARWHWPLLLIAALGVVGVVVGYRLHELPDWRGPTGFLLYFAGGAAAAVAPFLWRDARRAGARTTEKSSASLPSRPAA